MPADQHLLNVLAILKSRLGVAQGKLADANDVAHDEEIKVEVLQAAVDSVQAEIDAP